MEGGFDSFVGVDVGVKMPPNALDGTGDACVGVYVCLLRHLLGLIESLRRRAPNARSHRSGISRSPTSARVHAYPSNTSHRSAYRRTISPARSYRRSLIRHSFSDGFYRQ